MAAFGTGKHSRLLMMRRSESSISIACALGKKKTSVSRPHTDQGLFSRRTRCVRAPVWAEKAGVRQLRFPFRLCNFNITHIPSNLQLICFSISFSHHIRHPRRSIREPYRLRRMRTCRRTGNTLQAMTKFGPKWPMRSPALTWLIQTDGVKCDSVEKKTIRLLAVI
jgi:hypothetical protein